MSVAPPVVPGYEILSELGRGGFATVFRALQVSVQREVALKVIATPLSDDVVERRFRAECRTVGSLSWHPHVIVLHDAGLSEAGLPYLAMELIDDGSWGDRVRGDGALDAATASRVGAEVADALDEAHRAGIVHRDVKPDNVLIGRRGQSLLTDFGIATLTDATRSATGAFTGTIAFSAPELLRGERAGPRSDVYSLGLTVHALLTGATPFARTTDDSPAAVIWRVMSEPPDPLPTTVPAPLAELLAAATDKDPGRRPATAAEMFDAFSAFAHAPRPPASRPPGSRPPAPRPPAPTAGPAASPTPPPLPPPPSGPPPPAFAPPTWAGPPPAPPEAAPSPEPAATTPVVTSPDPDVAAGGARGGPPDAFAPTGPSGRRRRTAPLAVAVVAILVVLAAATWFATRGPDGGDDTVTSTTGADGGGSTEPVPSTAGQADGEPARCAGAADDRRTLALDDLPEAGDGSGSSVGLVLDVGGRDDASFNESAVAGLAAAADAYGVDTTVVEPDAAGSNRADLVRQMAEDTDLVIVVGFLFAEAIGPPGDVAAEFPGTKFVILDDDSVEAPNVTAITFAEQEGSYLAGVAAALKSGTGSIGFIGGVETPLIERFQAGFEAGVEAIDPDATVDARYITQPPDFAGFADPAAARSIAADMYDGDVDVIYHASGGSGGGVFDAAVAADRLAIGVDSDQYGQVDEDVQPCLLTSMAKRLDRAVATVVAEMVDDTLAAGPRLLDLAAGGLDLATSGGQLDDIADQLADARADVVDGRVDVPTTP